ncbi:MAG: NAD(P)/FAD-dependent oxidoreductase [Acidobacteriota bacterium]
MSDRIVIAGSGLGGSLLAVLLAKQGHEVSLYERRSDPRLGSSTRARSINLALSTRGLHALDQAGLKQQVLDMSVAMPGRMIHDRQGNTAFQPYGLTPDQAIYSMSRGGLNMALVEAAEALGVTVSFDRRCVGLDSVKREVNFRHEPSGRIETVTADLIVGGDGAFSAVRTEVAKLGRFDYSQSYLEHGYKELTIPATDDGGYRITPNALHIWPRGGFMMIALPNREGSFTVTCFWPYDGPNGFESLKTPDDVRNYFKATFPDAVPLMPALVEDYFRNPTSDLVTIRCRPWHIGDRVVLIGDSAHAIVPFYGQGANAAFEDCVVLAETLAEFSGNRARALAEYERRRKPHADALADLALKNFVEMRDKTASWWFRRGKQLEKLLARALPFWFRPLYSMVTFSRTPYADAVSRAAYQWRVVRWVGGSVAMLLLAILLRWILR